VAEAAAADRVEVIVLNPELGRSPEDGLLPGQGMMAEYERTKMIADEAQEGV
jgi:ribonucleotide monophosphatase NagD (HAD superfamily)